MMKNIRAHRMCAHTMYLNRWSSCDDERRAILMAHALLVVGYGQTAYGFSLSTTTTKQSFSRSPLFFFSEDVYLFSRVFFSLLLFTSQQTTTFSLSFSLFFFAVRSFRASERREEAQNDDTQTQTKEVSARVAFSVQITQNRKRVFFLFFFCFRV
jgi:hypothetical protein